MKKYSVNKKRNAIRRLAAVLIAAVMVLGSAFGAMAAEFGKDDLQDRRYVAFGFDDFRESDFMMVMPLLEAYEGHATFNKIGWSAGFTDLDNENIFDVLEAGHEMGDHTWHHWNILFNDPLFNGQDPDHPEGDQVPYPSNEQMREDRGDGKNTFGFDLKEACSEELAAWTDFSGDWQFFDTPWGELSDEECQMIREYYSIMCDTSGLLNDLDQLSDAFLGTEGFSQGSWDPEQGCYTGGIFTGCKSSANHEIWERVLEATQLAYELQNPAFEKFYTWSWPGGYSSPFQYEKDGIYYYDEACTIPYNYLARFESATLVNEDGSPKVRSWVDVLREYGYLMTHDFLYPSRLDGYENTMMSKQLIYNADTSRPDGLIYPTNVCIDYQAIQTEYEDFFDETSEKSRAAQMYDAGGSFYQFVEGVRHDTANGMVHGEVIDSSDTPSERAFLEEAFRYCKESDIQLVSKKEAYDICFTEDFGNGNLIYNPNLVNTAAAFMPDAETVPSNPDGYQGDCAVGKDKSLIVNGETTYLHYGTPVGDLTYFAKAKGEGTIRIYAIHNRDSVELDPEEMELLGEVSVPDSDKYSKYRIDFTVPDLALTEYEGRWGGYGDKIMGVMIVYSEGLQVKNINLQRQ